MKTDFGYINIMKHELNNQRQLNVYVYRTRQLNLYNRI